MSRLLIKSDVGLGIGSLGNGVAAVQNYLSRFGYLTEAAMELGSFDASTEQALRRFQSQYRLAETGYLDEATFELLSQPRCGNPDVEPAYELSGRRWARNDLTYAIREIPANLQMPVVQATLAAAFGVWAAATPLTFTLVNQAMEHDIDIRFVAGEHGDGAPFDGAGSVLAHAFYPPPNGGRLAGDMHFDASEQWVINFAPGGFDLLTVAVHEIGHALGLGHSNVFPSAMAPFYPNNRGALAQDDLLAIRRMYGPVAMGSALAAFSRVEGNRDLHRVHWSPDGRQMGSGRPLYEGSSPVTAMIAYQGGVLTAFTRTPGGNRIHWSANGESLGSGPIRYEGSSPVTAMIGYRNGVLTAFANAPGGNRIHWSPNGENLGGGPVHYQGASPITAMIPYQGGVLTAFTRTPGGNRIHWSPNGENLGAGPVRYQGSSPVTAMLAYQGGVLTAFAHAPGGNRIHWSQNGENLGAGEIRYEGGSPITALVGF
jgi:hypothetical protein